MQANFKTVEVLADVSWQSVCPDVDACIQALASDLHVSMPN